MKRSILHLLFVILTTGLFISCASQQKTTGSEDEQPESGSGLNIVVKPGTRLSTTDTLTIVNKLEGEDVAGAGAILTQRLMS